MTAAHAIATRPTKGEETRAQILAAAVEMASQCGFEALTIGSLAEKTGLSKSGLFAHFGSKLELQLATLDEAARQFTEVVFMPALKAPRGVRRLKALHEAWLTWPRRQKLPGGCPMDSASREYDHRPGPMRDAIMERQRQVERECTKAVQMAIDTGELAKDTDASQVAFEFLSIVLAFFRSELVHGPEVATRRARIAFDRLIESNRS